MFQQSSHQVSPSEVTNVLRNWLDHRFKKVGLNWLDDKLQQIESGAPEWVFFTSFSGVPRFTGKEDLNLTPSELSQADALRKHWNPQTWSTDQAARTLLVLTLPSGNEGEYFRRIELLFTTGDVGELVALYQSLPLLPFPERFRARAAEGLRSSMTSVFNAVALRNPYPAEFFDENAWNQMILKAVFVGSPLHEIQGLDERRNPKLARMLVDFAHERWSASRTVTPEIWRLVGPFAGDNFLDELERALTDENPDQQIAAALALQDASTPRARNLLDTRPDLDDLIREGNLTWAKFAPAQES